MTEPIVCPDCLSAVPASTDETCMGCGFVRPPNGWLPNPLEGLIINGRYRLEGRLGAGGMATVFRATRIGALGGTVAVKVLAPRFARTVVARRFEREAQVISRLTNPHIVRIYDFESFSLPGSDQPLYYLAMELVHGHTLAALLRKQGPVNPLWGIDVLRQLARGLDEAHDNGITHRDLKPQNIMLVRQREATHVKILDFGIAALTEQEGEAVEKLTKTGLVSGTPDYMAPEQAVGSAELGPAADMYSLGVLAFEMFTGTLPFSGSSAIDTLMQRVTMPAPPLARSRPQGAFPGELERIVDRLLEREPAARYPDAGALLDDLIHFPALQTTPDFVPDPEMVAQFDLAIRTQRQSQSDLGAAQFSPTIVAGAATRPTAHASPPVAAKKRRSGGLFVAVGALALATAATVAIVLATQAGPAVSEPRGLGMGVPLPHALSGPRPALPDGYRAHLLTFGDVSVEIAVPTAAAPLYDARPVLIAARRGDTELQLATAKLSLLLAHTGETVATVKAVGRAEDGRAVGELPALPVAGRYHVDAVLRFADGTETRGSLVYDAVSGTPVTE